MDNKRGVLDTPLYLLYNCVMFRNKTENDCNDQ